MGTAKTERTEKLRVHIQMERDFISQLHFATANCLLLRFKILFADPLRGCIWLSFGKDGNRGVAVSQYIF